MTASLRKLLGTVLLVSLVIAYAIVAMSLAVPLLAKASWWAQLAYFVIGGFLWIVPAMLLIRWMSRE